MKVVDKFELAIQPNGTPFYELDKYGAINSGLLIMDGSHSKWEDGKVHFNGVTYIEPDNDHNNGYNESFLDILPDSFELTNIDTADCDYDNDAKFLVLEASEFRLLLDTLEDYYKQLITDPVYIKDYTKEPEVKVSAVKNLYEAGEGIGLDASELDQFLTKFCTAFGLPKKLFKEDPNTAITKGVENDK